MQKIVKIPVGLPVAPGITENFSVFKSHTQFFSGRKREEWLDGSCNLLKHWLEKQSNGRGTARAQFWNNRFFAIVHIFHQNSIKSDDKIVKKWANLPSTQIPGMPRGSPKRREKTSSA